MSVIWKFCLPLFGSIIFQQLYNLADSFVAGKFIGDNALAAVGNSYEITLIFIAFAFGCNIGCSVIVSKFFGARKFNDMKTAVFTTWIAGGVLCAILIILGLTLSEGLLKLIRTPSEIMADSKLYLDIYGACRLCSSTTSQRVFSRQWGTAARRLYSLLARRLQISVWIFCSSRLSKWASRALRGRRSFVKA